MRFEEDEFRHNDDSAEVGRFWEEMSAIESGTGLILIA
jgi:hypothetical protein